MCSERASVDSLRQPVTHKQRIIQSLDSRVTTSVTFMAHLVCAPEPFTSDDINHKSSDLISRFLLSPSRLGVRLHGIAADKSSLLYRCLVAANVFLAVNKAQQYETQWRIQCPIGKEYLPPDRSTA